MQPVPLDFCGVSAMLMLVSIQSRLPLPPPQPVLNVQPPDPGQAAASPLRETVTRLALCWVRPLLRGSHRSRGGSADSLARPRAACSLTRAPGTAERIRGCPGHGRMLNSAAGLYPSRAQSLSQL